MQSISTKYADFVRYGSTFNKLQNAQITVTETPIAAVVELMNDSSVTAIGIVDLVENVDLMILSVYASVIINISFTTSLHVTANQLKDNSDVLKLLISPIILDDSASEIASIYSFIKGNFPLISISSNGSYMVPQPDLQLIQSTDSTLLFSFATWPLSSATSYDTYTPSLVCTTTNSVCSELVTHLDAATSYDFILTFTGSNGLVASTTALTFTTRLVLEQQLGDLTFNYYNDATSLFLVDDDGNSSSVVSTDNGFACPMMNNSLVGQTKTFSLYDTGSLVCLCMELTVVPFNVPTPIFHFTNVGYQTVSVIFDIEQSEFDDLFVINLTDKDSGIVLFSNLAADTQSVDVDGYAAGQMVTIVAETVGAAGLTKTFELSQFTNSADTLEVSQIGQTLTFSWSGRLLNAVVKLPNNQIVASSDVSPIEYVMQDNLWVGNTSSFYLEGNPEIGTTQYSTNQVSIAFPSLFILPFQIPSPKYRLTYDGSGVLLCIEHQNLSTYDNFTYAVQCSNGSTYAEILDTTEPFPLGNSTSFSVSTIGTNGGITISHAYIFYHIAEVPASVEADAVFIVDTGSEIAARLQTGALNSLKISQIISTDGTFEVNLSIAIQYASIISTPISVTDSSDVIRASFNALALLTNCLNIFPQPQTTPMQVSTPEFSVCKTIAGLFSPLLTVVDTAESISAFYSILFPVTAIISTSGIVRLTANEFFSNPTAPVASIEINDSGGSIASNLLVLQSYSTISTFTSNDGANFDVPSPSFVISAVYPTIANILISLPLRQEEYDTYAFIIFNPVTNFVYKRVSVGGAISIDGLNPGYVYDIAVKAVGKLGLTRQTETQTFSTMNALISNICFPKDTMITCDQGIIAIQSLTSFNTFNGYAVQAITSTVSTDDHLILLKMNSLKLNVPYADLRMSKDHAVFWNGKLQKAKNLVEGTKIHYTGEILYNVLLQVHGLMNVHGVACETLHPSNSVVRLYMGEKFNVSEWNEYVTKSKIFI